MTRRGGRRRRGGGRGGRAARLRVWVQRLGGTGRRRRSRSRAGPGKLARGRAGSALLRGSSSGAAGPGAASYAPQLEAPRGPGFLVSGVRAPAPAPGSRDPGQSVCVRAATRMRIRANIRTRALELQGGSPLLLTRRATTHTRRAIAHAQGYYAHYAHVIDAQRASPELRVVCQTLAPVTRTAEAAAGSDKLAPYTNHARLPARTNLRLR